MLLDDFGAFAESAEIPVLIPELTFVVCCCNSTLAIPERMFKFLFIRTETFAPYATVMLFLML